ncbi:FecCD family ABC transporter permease [Corynebacterium otitidis]|uniref:Iron ABC transport system, permease n=1 Tax=Corynebacterium otitidis ATCC 51513 TaxID=883169 RepID=I7JWN6_9CORY|nr:iron ABC transporter permease [Corynebacterium otitidis]EJZ81355.1 hypothetical protein HMPREF9719_01763 [Corynebacterium otitidis ATCC 51513]KKO83962.1 iron ABC transporter permease [Corynebacterium otitidis]CCI83981.1 iron ABC transport system, permease [Corynebacterium otitidis ATCC 51513]
MTVSRKWGIALVIGVSVAVVAATFAWRLLRVEGPESAPWLEGEVFAVTRDRLIAATVIGAGLGIAGLLLRTATSNPLADPSITGVNSGASLGAVLGTTLLGGATGAAILPGSLIGASIAIAITVGIGLRGHVADPSGAIIVQRMVLLGMAVSALFSALTSIVLVLDEAQLATVLSWLSGRLGGVGLDDLIPAIVALLVVAPLVIAGARGLDTLAAGDLVASSVGADPRRLRIGAVSAAVVLVASGVAAAGPIGFLGLMAAVVVHRVCGPRHRIGIVVAAAVGAAVLIVSDSIAQALWAPAETPVGIVTALAGFPLLLWGIRNLTPKRPTAAAAAPGGERP